MASRLPRIAVVDGDASSRERISRILSALGWSVQEFASIAEATFALVPCPPDLLIVDVNLPDGLGLNLLEIVRRRRGEKVTSIVVTEVADESEVLRCFAAGAADVIAKPVREHELVARCRARLADAAEPEPMSPDTPDVPTREGLAFGRYKIVRELGRGGFGIVYLAEDGEAGRLVALKVSTPPVDDGQAQARFVRETHVLSTIKSAHVVRMLDNGVLHGRLFYAMEYAPGPSLARRVSERGPLSEADARVLAGCLLDALAAAHDVGVVHRDVKPANVILKGGEVRLAVLVDFGLAKKRQDRTLTKASGEILLGTPAYMPPEVIRGESEHTHQSDLWGLGVTLRYALDGEEIWPGLTGMNLIHAVASRPVPPVRAALSKGFSRLLHSLCANDPAARPPSAVVALEALTRIVFQEPPVTLPEPTRHGTQTLRLEATPPATSVNMPLDIADTPRVPRPEKPPGPPEAPV